MTKTGKIVVAILTLLVIANLVAIVLYLVKSPAHNVTSPSITIVKGQKGDIGPIGLTGDQGIPGLSMTGPQGASGSDGQSLIGPAGPTGSPGQDGQTAREIELRTNPTTNDLEWHYVGDDLWTVLMPYCRLTNTCP